MQLHVISPIKCANLSLMLAHHPFLTSSASKCRIALGNISSCVGICGFGSARNVCQCRLPLPSSLLPLNPPCDVPRRVRLHCDYLSNLALTLFAPSLCLYIYMQSSRGGENEIKESEETGGGVEELVAARAQQRSDQKESAETNMPSNIHAVSP